MFLEKQHWAALNARNSVKDIQWRGASGPLQEWMKEASDLKAALDEHGIVAITDPKGRVTFANDKFCVLSKYSREELLGEDYRTFSSGTRPAEFFREFWPTIARHGVWHGEIEHRAKDRSLYWLATTIVPMTDPRGTLQHFLVMGSDITERKRTEVELAFKVHLQQLLAGLSSRLVAVPPEGLEAAIDETQRLILDAIGLDHSALWQLDEYGTKMVLLHSRSRRGLPRWRPTFPSEKSLPWIRAQILRGEMVSFNSVEELPAEAARDAEIIRVRGPKSHLIIPLVVNGRVFGALAFSNLETVRKWRGDEIVGLRVAAEIIANRMGLRQAELREEQLRAELAYAQRGSALGEMIGALAHELNQPLAAILSNAQAARRFIAGGEINPVELHAILDDMVRDDKRAGNVIHNLRAMVSKQPAIREACCLNDVVREVTEILNGELIEAKVAVRQILAPNLALVKVARVELQQVLVNLFANAIQAMEGTSPELRAIEVETCAGEGVIMVSVQDHGPGIQPAQLMSIFGPFVSTKASGLGLGLSICRRIIENHAGRIEARNRAGGGASFSFTLPVCASVRG